MRAGSDASATRPAAVLVVFLLTLQNVLLSALLTFATEPWYGPYRQSAPDHGLDPLVDQHLAGVIMWVPVGFIHVGIALGLLGSWLAGDTRHLTPRREST